MVQQGFVFLNPIKQGTQHFPGMTMPAQQGRAVPPPAPPTTPASGQATFSRINSVQSSPTLATTKWALEEKAGSLNIRSQQCEGQDCAQFIQEFLFPGTFVHGCRLS